jgi:peptide/nickel transport system permease protein
MTTPEAASRPLSQPGKSFPLTNTAGASVERPILTSPLPLIRWVGVVLLVPSVVAAVAAPQLAPYNPIANVGMAFQPPSAQYWLGTDDLGRDVLSAVIYGARTSLIVGVSVAALTLLLGTALGLIAGFVGGWVDEALMRLTELFQILPRFFLAIAVIALFGSSLLNVVLVLALTSWSGLARIARAEVLSLRERDYILAARAVGIKSSGILWRHLLPNAIQPLLAATSIVVGSAILTEASLSFLGLGDPNTISWGYLLNNAQPFIRRAWWLPVFPGLAISLTVLGLSLVLDEIGK